MRNNKSLVAAISLALAATLPAQAVFAQSDDASEASVFEEVIVTATKREESIFEVPVAVSAFTEEVIFKQGITDLTDIGKFVPNLTVTGFSAGHTASVNPFIRGIGIQDHLITTDPGVSVYVDGVYLGRQVGQNWSLANIERVEVLRGPQGTLYGRNSIGGAINIVTRKPGEEEGGRASVTVGTLGRLNGDFYWNQPVTESFAYSVTASYFSRDGVGDFLSHNAAHEVGELQEWAVRLAARWEVTDDFSMLLTFDKNDGEGGLRPYDTLIDEVPTGLLYGTGARNADVWGDPYDNAGGFYTDEDGNIVDRSEVFNKAYGWSLTADWDISENLAMKLLYSDRSSEYGSGLDDDAVAETIFTYPETGYADQDSLELQLLGDFGSWDFVAGFYDFEEMGGNRQDPNFFLGGPGIFINEQRTESRAVYGNVGFNVADDVRLSIGARYTEDEKFAHTEPIVGLLRATNSRDWDEMTWEAAVSWGISERMNLYATIQSGYQSGQYPARAYCLFGALQDDGSISEPNCYVAGENITATNYEVGIKGRPTDTLQMSAAVFYTDY